MKKKIMSLLMIMIICSINLNNWQAIAAVSSPKLKLTPSKTTVTPGETITIGLTLLDANLGCGAYTGKYNAGTDPATCFETITFAPNNKELGEINWKGISNPATYQIGFATAGEIYNSNDIMGTFTIKIDPDYTGSTIKFKLVTSCLDHSDFSVPDFYPLAGPVEVNLTVELPKSTNNNLASLTIDNGTLVPNFAAGTTNYNVDLGPITKTEPVQIGATLADSKASFASGKGPRTINVSPGVNVSENIEVVAESGAKKTYVISFKSQDGNKSDEKELTSVTANGLTFTQSADKTTFSASAPFSMTSVNPSYTTSPKANVSAGSGVINLNVGANTRTVTVKSERGTTKNYTININRAKNSDSKPTGIKVDGVALPGYNPTTQSYSITVPSSQSKVVITGAPLPEGATEVLSAKANALEYGLNTVTLIVTAQDGTPTTYTFNVTRTPQSSDSSLKTLTVSPGVVLTPEFKPGINSYTATVPFTTTEVTVAAAASDAAATVEAGLGKHPLTVVGGENTIKVTAKAADGSTSTYTIKIFREAQESPKSKNNYLSSLKVIGLNLSPAFDKDVTSYSVEVPSKEEKAIITASEEDSKSKVQGAGLVNIPYGKSTKLIKVTAENGSVRTYSITFNRVDDRSKDNNLKSLSVNGQKLSPAFNSSRTTYNLEVDEKTSKIVVNAEAADSKAKVEGDGAYTIPFGQKVISIKVTAENEAAKTYKIYVKRASKDNTLNQIVLGNGILTPEFNKDVLKYNMDVPYEVTTLDINAIPTVVNSKIEIVGNKDLKVGKNEIKIKVTAQSGEVKEYIIEVNRMEKTSTELSSNNFARSIIIEGAELDPKFNKNTSSYTVKVGKDVKDLDITVITEDSKAKYTVTGNKDLQKGTNRVLVTITAENGQNKIYAISVVKGNQMETDLYYAAIIGIILLILILIIIILLLKKRKEDQEDDEQIEETVAPQRHQIVEEKNETREISYDEQIKNNLKKELLKEKYLKELREEAMEEILEEEAEERLEEEEEEKRKIEIEKAEAKLEEEELRKELMKEIKQEELKEELKKEIIKELKNRKKDN